MTFLNNLHSHNITPILQYQVPQMDSIRTEVPKELAKRLYFGRDISTVSVERKEHAHRQALMTRVFNNIKVQCGFCYFYDPAEALCASNGTCSMFESAFEPFYSDAHHLSHAGRNVVMSHFFSNKTSALSRLIS